MTTIWQLFSYLAQIVIDALNDIDFLYGLSLWNIILIIFVLDVLAVIIGTIFKHKSGGESE